MTTIVALLQAIASQVSKTTLRQLSHVIFGMLVMTGRVTMLGMSRWTEPGGSYRTIQRFFHTEIPWAKVLWTFFEKLLWQSADEYILAGDEVVIGKAGKETHGLDRFFSSLQQRPISGLSFFTFSLVNVRERQSSPVQVTQVVRSETEQAERKAKAKAKQEPKPVQPRKVGRPTGSQNKKGQAVVLSAELQRIQTALQDLLQTIGETLPLKYLALDGHFGNYPSAKMVCDAGLHLISKLRYDAALYFPYRGEYGGHGPHRKYGDKVKVRQMEQQYLKETTRKGNLRTDIYQTKLLYKAFGFELNVVIILKTNLVTQAQAHVILFSTDLDLPFQKIITLYSLRFQIEFNFRDAKQYWGLEDFMNIEETAVTNAANLSLFMTSLSALLLQPHQRHQPDYSILDLKAHYRGLRYAQETIKMLPEKPDGNLLANIFLQIARLGMIHPGVQPTASP